MIIAPQRRLLMTHSGLQFVGGKTVGLAGTTSNISLSLTGLSGGLASAPAAGDLVIIALGIAATSNLDMTVIFPSGWTQSTDVYDNSSYDTNALVAFKQMGGTPDTTVTLTGGTQATANAGIALIQVWRGADLASVAPGFASTGFTNSVIPNPPAPAASPTTLGAVQLGFGLGSASSATLSGKSYSASFYDQWFDTGVQTATNSIIGGHGWRKWVSGADNPPAFTFTGSDTGAGSANDYTLTLEAA